MKRAVKIGPRARPAASARHAAYLPVIARGGTPPAWWNDNGTIALSDIVAVWQPKGAASYAASKLDLTPNANNLTDGAAFPTWSSALGWIILGTLSQYLISTVVAESGYSAICRFSVVANAGALFGSYDNLKPLTRFNIFPAIGGAISYQQGGQLAVAPTLTAGTVGITNQTGYRDGSPDAGAIPGWSGTNLLPLFIGAYNFKGSPSGFIICRIQALAIYNTNIAAHVASLHTLIMSI